MFLFVHGRRYEGQRAQLMQQSFNMEQASFMTQTMQDTMVQVQAMKGANEAMKANFKEISLDDIEVRRLVELAYL